jgi:1,4-dihydroxy-2-naphthoyl-CoA hydrolase
MPSRTAEELNEFGKDRLPGLLGLQILTCEPSQVSGRIPITRPLIAGTGFLWAPVVIALADTLCAYGTGRNLPEGASFTTVELKTNFLGTVGEGGVIAGRATPVHLGRTTQVWDAVVTNEATGKTIALFRCTQMILYRGGAASAGR